MAQDLGVLAHVISLVDWPKHVKSIFFFIAVSVSDRYVSFEQVWIRCTWLHGAKVKAYPLLHVACHTGCDQPVMNNSLRQQCPMRMNKVCER